MEIRDSTKRLFTESSNPAVSQLGYQEEGPKAVYNKNRIFVGWNIGGKKLFQKLVDKCKQRTQSRNDAIREALYKFPEFVGAIREPVFIDRESADLIFYGGERGSGKSYNLRGETNQESEADVNQVIIDPEHEFYTNNKDGIQDDLENLREKEQPKPVDTAVLMPEFVRKARQRKSMTKSGYSHEGFQAFKFEFADLDPNDLEFIFRQVDDGTDVMNFTSELERSIDSGELIRSWDDVKQVADDLDQEDVFTYHKRAQQLSDFVENGYEKWDFLGTDQRISLPEIFEKYDTVVLSLNDGGELPNKYRMKELYVAILVKRVRDAIQQGKISKPVTFTLDEAHEYVPADKDADEFPSKKELKRAIKKDRKRGFRLNLASQEPHDVQEDNFLNQTTHFFVPHNMKPRPRKHLLKKSQVFRSGDDQRGKWDEIFEAMSDVLEYGWLYANSDSKQWCILEPVSPIANHLRE
jgi:hypothetical protein